VGYLLQFRKNRSQVASSFQHVRNHWDITPTNLTEIALKSLLKIAAKNRWVKGSCCETHQQSEMPIRGDFTNENIFEHI